MTGWDRSSSSFWNACAHPERTDEDVDGNAICVACGAVLIVRLAMGKPKVWEVTKRELEGRDGS